MTRKRDLKSPIRERMAKTGERYAAARHAIVSTPGEASGPIVPKGWTAAGQAPRDYVFATDPAQGPRGKPSAVIRARVAQPAGFATLVQTILADDYRDRRVQLAGWLRSEAVAGHAKLWLRADAEGARPLAFGQSALVEGTTDWSRHAVVLDVPPGAATLLFGLLLDGAGAAWLSGPALEIVGRDVPLAGVAELPRAPRNLDFDE